MGQKYNDKFKLEAVYNFVSRDLDLWAYANNVILDLSRPGKPTDNAQLKAWTLSGPVAQRQSI